MKKVLLLILILASYQVSLAQQEVNESKPLINIRASLLLFPPTPLLTIEVLPVERLSIQCESNFGDTHGVNVKYYRTENMNGTYFFTGLAWVENELLRENGGFTRLPYGGIGIANRFGKREAFVFDGRFGIGPTLNADNNSVYPVIKLGLGLIVH